MAPERKVTECGVCEKSITKKTKSVYCFGDCGKWFHLKCSSLSDNQFELLDSESETIEKWKCDKCRHRVEVSIKGSGATIANINRVGEKVPTIADVYQMMIKMQASNLSMQAAIEFMSNKYDDIKKDTEHIKTLVQEISGLKKENLKLKTEVEDLSVKVNALEQYSRNYNIEIQGVPIMKDENTYDIVASIAQAANCNIVGNDIEFCHRLQNSDRNPNKPPAIIAKFYTRQAKIALLKNIKSKKLEAKDIGFASSPNSLFINEHLTATNKNLFWLARNTRTSLGYKFAWTRDGRVLLRKDENSPVLRINKASDIPHQ